LCRASGFQKKRTPKKKKQAFKLQSGIMHRWLRESNIPDGNLLLQCTRVEWMRFTDPVTVIYSEHIPTGLTVLRGSYFMYLKEDQGYYIRTYLGDNLVYILRHFMSRDATTDISIRASHGVHKLVTIRGSNWQFDILANAFNWDRFTNAVIKLQRRIRCILLHRALKGQYLSKYKKVLAFTKSRLAQWMHSDVINLIVSTFVNLKDLKKEFPVFRIETESFKKIRAI
jgi:hypothetical protein